MGRALREGRGKKEKKKERFWQLETFPFFFSAFTDFSWLATGETPARTPPGHRPLSSPTLFYPYLVLDHAAAPAQPALGFCLYALRGHRY